MEESLTHIFDYTSSYGPQNGQFLFFDRFMDLFDFSRNLTSQISYFGFSGDRW